MKKRHVARMDVNTATVEIEITPPGPPGTAPWWTVLFDGMNTTVRAVPALGGDQPEDWGIMCTRPQRIQAWLAEGGSGHVIDRILDGFASAGARARIVAVHGTDEPAEKLHAALRAFAEANPGCAPELHRFTHEGPKGDVRGSDQRAMP